MTSAQPTGDTTVTNDRSRAASWLLSGILGVGLLFLASVHAPQRIKLPLITPVALGIAAGWGLGRWALARRLTVPRFVMAASFGLIAAGEIGVAVETYRLGKPELQRAVKRLAPQDDGMANRVDEALLEQTTDPSVRDEMRQQNESAQRRRQEELDRQQRLLTFAGYLENRIPKAWGRWPAGWPEVFWATEVLVAGALGAWMAGRIVAPNPAP